MSCRARAEGTGYSAAEHRGEIGLAKRRGGFFTRGIIAAAMLAAAGIGSYYGVYVPARDAKLAAEQALAKAQAEAEMRAGQQRLLAQRQAAEERQAQAQAAAQIRYQACLHEAVAAHDASWAPECKNLHDKDSAAHADCLDKLKLPKTYCDSAYVIRDDSPKCTLPAEIASVIDADLERARNRCRKEKEAAEGAQ